VLQARVDNNPPTITPPTLIIPLKYLKFGTSGAIYPYNGIRKPFFKVCVVLKEVQKNPTSQEGILRPIKLELSARLTVNIYPCVTGHRT
jgi:hypothetical protein